MITYTLRRQAYAGALQLQVQVTRNCSNEDTDDYRSGRKYQFILSEFIWFYDFQTLLFNVRV